MRTITLALLLVLTASAAPLAANPAAEHPEHNYAPIPVGPSANPADITGVLFAKSFTLDQPYMYTWRHDQPAITSGWLLVVGVRPELAPQKSTWNPVLYVGRYPAEIAATDGQAGRMVVVVPGDVDLTHDPIYFGSVELPGEVSPERAAQEMEAAIAAGFRALTPEALRLAEAAGGAAAHVTDARALYAGPLADAVDAYAPEAAGIAAGFRAPLVETTRQR